MSLGVQLFGCQETKSTYSRIVSPRHDLGCSISSDAGTADKGTRGADSGDAVIKSSGDEGRRSRGDVGIEKRVTGNVRYSRAFGLELQAGRAHTRSSKDVPHLRARATRKESLCT